MKPTQEQVEASYLIADMTTRQEILAFLAARDAERDARWEALRVAASRMWSASHIALLSPRKWREIEAPSCELGAALDALANLGAEEKQ